MSLTGNTLADPDGDEVVTNTIDGSLSCAASSPAPQVATPKVARTS